MFYSFKTRNPKQFLPSTKKLLFLADKGSPSPPLADTRIFSKVYGNSQKDHSSLTTKKINKFYFMCVCPKLSEKCINLPSKFQLTAWFNICFTLYSFGLSAIVLIHLQIFFTLQEQKLNQWNWSNSGKSQGDFFLHTDSFFSFKQNWCW